MAVQYEWRCPDHGLREVVYDDLTGPAPLIFVKPCTHLWSDGKVCGNMLDPDVRTVPLAGTGKRAHDQ